MSNLSPSAPQGQQSNTSASDAAWQRYQAAMSRTESDKSPAAVRELEAAIIYWQAAIAGAVR